MKDFHSTWSSAKIFFLMCKEFETIFLRVSLTSWTIVKQVDKQKEMKFINWFALSIQCNLIQFFVFGTSINPQRDFLFSFTLELQRKHLENSNECFNCNSRGLLLFKIINWTWERERMREVCSMCATFHVFYSHRDMCALDLNFSVLFSNSCKTSLSIDIVSNWKGSRKGQVQNVFRLKIEREKCRLTLQLTVFLLLFSVKISREGKKVFHSQFSLLFDVARATTEICVRQKNSLESENCGKVVGFSENLGKVQKL